MKLVINDTTFSNIILITENFYPEEGINIVFKADAYELSDFEELKGDINKVNIIRDIDGEEEVTDISDYNILSSIDKRYTDNTAKINIVLVKDDAKTADAMRRILE
jgi:hypothetical protein